MWGVVCHPAQRLFLLKGRGEKKSIQMSGEWERTEWGVCQACASSSKRRSYGSWLSEWRGELLKTNSQLNSGCDAVLEPTFVSEWWEKGLRGGGTPCPQPVESSAGAMKYRPLVRDTSFIQKKVFWKCFFFSCLRGGDVLTCRFALKAVRFHCGQMKLVWKFLGTSFGLRNSVNLKDTGESEIPQQWGRTVLLQTSCSLCFSSLICILSHLNSVFVISTSGLFDIGKGVSLALFVCLHCPRARLSHGGVVWPGGILLLHWNYEVTC